MDDHKDEFSIVKMSETLGVSRSGYYRWRDRGPSRRALKNNQLTQKITRIWKDSAKTYGSPRIHAALLADGETLSRPRVARLMKKADIASQIRPKWITTTDSAHELPVAPNVLDRDFTAERPGQVWAGDITYLPSSEGWLYLTTIMDLADRQIVGWSLSRSMDAEATTIPAWEQDCTRRRPGDELLEAKQATQSMSRKGNCWDNAPAESFFKTIKAELPVDPQRCNYGQLREAIFEYIEIWYNRKRLHSSLDYRAPAQIENLLTSNKQQAA